MRHAALLLLLSPALVAEEDPDRYHSLWDALETKVEQILVLASPYREDALRQYHVCMQKLGEFCDSNDAYIAACQQTPPADSAERERLAKIARTRWEEYFAAYAELQRRITEGAVASRKEEVRPGEDAPKESPAPENPPAETPPAGTPAPGVPDPGQSPWVVHEKTLFEKLAPAVKAAVKPAFEAALSALDAYTAAQGAYAAARDRSAAASDAAEREKAMAEMRRLEEEMRKLREAFQARREEYQRAKSRALREGRPEAPAEDALGSYLDGVRSGYGAANGKALPEGGRWATLASLLDLADRAGRTGMLAADLRALGSGDVRARGERFGRALAGARAK